MNRQRLESVMRQGVATLAALVVLLAAARADGSPVSRALTRDGYALAYNLQFTACYDMLEKATAADPLDPAPRRAMAAVTWIEILFAQGVATFEAFTGEITKGDVVRPIAPPILAGKFRRAIDEALRLADQQLVRKADADGHYQVGATQAVAALYGGTVEGRLVGSFSQGRRAVSALERARVLEPGRREAALVLGMSEYTVSTMSWPIRTLARLGGLSGNRATGLAMLKEASAPGAETESDALMLLMIIDNREGRPADALGRLEYLQGLHPENRLLWLNHGASAMAAGRPIEAERLLSQGIATHRLNALPAVLGETALWFACRGIALAALHRREDAETDLRRGLASDPRDWVRGRIHAQLGDLAVASGDRALARREYQTALGFAERGGDRSGIRNVKQKASALGRASN